MIGSIRIGRTLVARAAMLLASILALHGFPAAAQGDFPVVPKARWLGNPVRTLNDFANQDGRVDQSTSAVPTAAFIMVRLANGASETCSGVLVGEREILTAAHCVCGLWGRPDFHGDAAECSPYLADLRVRVFLPAAGLFEVSAPPLTHPQYRAVRPGAPANARSAHDLALLTLDEAPGLTPTPLAKAAKGERYIMANYGVLALTTTEGLSEPSAVDKEYKPGVGQAALMPPLQTDCTARAAQDMVCTLFTRVGALDPVNQTTGGCGGDSGAPLLEFREGRVGGVVGVAAATTDGAGCADAMSRFTLFTDVARPEHRAWIQEHVTAPSGSLRDRACGDFAVGTNRPRLALEPVAEAGLISISGRERRDGSARPRFTIQGVDPAGCRRDETYNITTCRFAPGDRPRFEHDGEVQVTVCWLQKDERA